MPNIFFCFLVVLGIGPRAFTQPHLSFDVLKVGKSSDVLAESCSICNNSRVGLGLIEPSDPLHRPGDQGDNEGVVSAGEGGQCGSG
jgi:hypothetical protein